MAWWFILSLIWGSSLCWSGCFPLTKLPGVVMLRFWDSELVILYVALWFVTLLLYQLLPVIMSSVFMLALTTCEWWCLELFWLIPFEFPMYSEFSSGLSSMLSIYWGLMFRGCFWFMQHWLFICSLLLSQLCLVISLSLSSVLFFFFLGKLCLG